MSDRPQHQRPRADMPAGLAARVDLPRLQAVADADVALENLIIRHREFENLTKRLASHQARFDPNPLREAGVLLVTGMSGSGKSTAVKRYAAEFPAVSGPEGIRRTVLFVKVPSGGDKHSLQRRILSAMDVPIPPRDAQDKLTLLIDRHLRAQRVELMILDEANHLADTKTNQGRFLAADMIKEFANFNSCQIALVGMPSAITLLERNMQLDRRSRGKHEVKAYDWTSVEDRDDYEDFLEAFAEATQFRRPPPLAGWSEALSVASNGLVGITSLFVVRANGIAMTAGDGELRLDHLAAAFDELKPKGTKGNPFVDLKSVRFPANYRRMLTEGIIETTNLRRRRGTYAADEEGE